MSTKEHRTRSGSTTRFWFMQGLGGLQDLYYMDKKEICIALLISPTPQIVR